MLMYSTAKDQPITYEELAKIPTPPARGRFHHPYPFHTYVDDVTHALKGEGIEVLSQEFAVSKNHQRMFGIMEIGARSPRDLPPLEGELITSKEWQLLVGLRGAHDQKIPRGLVLGSSVTVCSNLCFSGNVGQFRTKQTTNIGARLPALIRDAVQKIPALAHRQERVFDAYRNVELKPRGGDAALVEVYRRGALSTDQLGRAIEQWHDPEFDEHAAEGWSAWRLMNSVTQALKPVGEHVNMDLVAHRTQITSKFLDEICHIDF